MAVADTTKPVLTSLSFPAIVNVKGGGKSVSFTAGATDIGLGVNHVMVQFNKSWQGSASNTSYIFTYDSNDSFADGQSSTNFFVDSTSAAGIYAISYVYVYDKAGNYTSYSSGDLTALGIATSFEIQSDHGADTTAPMLTSLSFPTMIDVTTGGQSITFTAGATDMGVGVSHVSVTFSKSWQSGSSQNNYLYTYDTNDSFSDGTSSNNFTISSTSAAGTYAIEQVYVYDKAGNYTGYSSGDLAAMGIATSFEIRSDYAEDTTAPVLTSLSFPATVDVTAGRKSVAFTVAAPDTGLGVGHVMVQFNQSWQSASGSTSYVFTYDSNDSFADGKSSTTIQIDPASAAGTYTIEYVYVYDKAGNYTRYASGDLAAAGIATSFEIVDRNAPVTAEMLVPASITEASGSIAPTLTLSDVGSYSGTVTLAFDAARSTVRARDVDVPAYSGVFNIAQSPAGDYAITLPSIGVFDDLLIEGDELLVFRVGASGRIFESGSDHQTVTVTIRDKDRAGTAGRDVMQGDSGNNYFAGLAGDDSLYGYAGNDLLDGGIGADYMDGGYGNDIYHVDNAGDVVVEKVSKGYDTVVASIGYTLTDNVEALKLVGLTAGVDGHGNALNNVLDASGVTGPLAAGTVIRLYGEGGNDSLTGSQFGDVLDGGTGADTMTGGYGNDIYHVDNAGDVVVEKVSKGYDTVIASVGHRLADNVEALKLAGLNAGVDGHGNALNNVLDASGVTGPLAAGTVIRLYGEAGNDSLTGSQFGDVLDGGAGADVMQGGYGNDIYYVDNAGDVVVEKVSKGYDTVFTTIDYRLADNVEALKIADATAGVRAYGNGLDNLIDASAVTDGLLTGKMRLFGEGGNDVLIGSRYGDVLTGGAGNDRLTGGRGADRFHFGDALNAATNVDTITDFQSGDLIQLDRAIFGGLSAGALSAGALSADAFVANADGVATSAGNRIVYDSDSGRLFYDADGSGAGAAVLFAVLANHAPLTAAEFVVV